MDIGNGGGADDAAQEANRIRYFVLIIRNVQVEDRGGCVNLIRFVIRANDKKILSFCCQVHVPDQPQSDEGAGGPPASGRPAGHY